LHGLRGVGKTTLAAAYAERHRNHYRATWWIRAQTESTMRADLVSLGVRLGWVAADQEEEPALDKVRERLRDEGEGLLLIYDNAIDAASLKPYRPLGGASRVLVTSNAPAWREIAVQIRVWSGEIGADYLLARTGRGRERAAAQALSETLGGLPLALEQAAAYCERLDVSFADYTARFEAAPAKMLDTKKDAPAEYHDKLTVSKTFGLAINAAAKLHPAADTLIMFAALLAPEPIPLFLFSVWDESPRFWVSLILRLNRILLGAPSLSREDVESAVVALRAFALIDREPIYDERDPAIVTQTIRLHRLVREVAAARLHWIPARWRRRMLINWMAAIYPSAVFDDPSAWPRARRLDALAVDLVAGPPPRGAEATASILLNYLGSYRLVALGAASQALPLFERAAAISEKALGQEHPITATNLNSLALVLWEQDDFARARPLFERALAIREKRLGPEHADTAMIHDNLALVLKAQSDLAGAQLHHERALAIYEMALGQDHPETATCLQLLSSAVHSQGDVERALALAKRALAIREKTLGSEHFYTAASLSNLANLLQDKGDLVGARPLHERALAIREKALGPEHPATATTVNDLAVVLRGQGDLAGARSFLERALAIREKALGPEHPATATTLNDLAVVLRGQGDLAGARSLHERALPIHEKALGPEHPWTATVLDNLGVVLRNQGDFAEARSFLERALPIHEKLLGPDHPNTIRVRSNLANLRCAGVTAARC
jgi:tetratricopeptide (TPR) repeat protein